MKSPRLPTMLLFLAVLAGAAIVASIPARLAAPAGLLAGLLLALTLAISPLQILLGEGKTGWLARHRRLIGLSCFVLAGLHVEAVLVSLGTLQTVLRASLLPAYWTGWLGFLLLLPVAITSVPRLHDALGRHWRTVQRLAWPAAVACAAHWWLQSGPAPTFVLVAGLTGLLEAGRIARRFMRRQGT